MSAVYTFAVCEWGDLFLKCETSKVSAERSSDDGCSRWQIIQYIASILFARTQVCWHSRTHRGARRATKLLTLSHQKPTQPFCVAHISMYIYYITTVNARGLKGDREGVIV
jgi:hypothetical protein